MASALALLSNAIVPQKAKSAEGAYRPGPYLLDGGWLSAKAGKLWNFWQSGYSLQPYGAGNAMCEACVSAYSQTVAMCPGDHWWGLDDGGRERVTNSALYRILKSPNDYQSISDLLLNLTRRLYEKGEAFGLAIRNDRNEIDELHWMRNGYVRIAEDGSIFYDLSGNEIVERRFDLSAPIPARDVLHIRLHTPRHPLKGESPILATMLDLALSGAALNQQIAFYLNQARPSFMLETDQKLTRPEAEEARARWEAQTQGENAGGTPILSWGLKAKEVTKTAKDGELADMMKMSDQNVALAYRVPLQVFGIGGTPFASTEALMSSWRAMGLGFALNHIEEAFGKLFRLKGFPDEYLELDTKALLRSNFKEQIEALSKSVLSGIHSSDDARNEIDLPVTPGGYGKMPRVQQQVVPLSYGAAMKPPKQATEKPPAAAPAPADPNNAQFELEYSSDEILRRINDHAVLH
jgi:HK97 family phage portal protein